MGAALGESGEAAAALMRRERGTKLITYDLNVRPAVEADAAPWRQPVQAIAACADIVTVSGEGLAFPALEAPRGIVAFAVAADAAGGGSVLLRVGAVDA